MSKLIEMMKSVIEQFEIIIEKHKKNHRSIKEILIYIRYVLKSNARDILRLLISGFIFTGFYIGMKYYILSNGMVEQMISLIISGICFFTLIRLYSED